MVVTYLPTKWDVFKALRTANSNDLYLYIRVQIEGDQTCTINGA